jgi:hypothetical protein
MIHQVFPDGIVPPGKKGNLQLRAHAIGGADEYRLAETREMVRSAERTDIGENAGSESAAREFLDRRNGAIRLVDVHAGIAVTNLFSGGQISV